MTGSESGSDGRKPIHSRPPSGFSPGRKRFAFSSIAFERAEVRRPVEPAKFDRAADAQAVGERRDDEAVAGEDQLRFTSKADCRQRRVVAALGLERDASPNWRARRCDQAPAATPARSRHDRPPLLELDGDRVPSPACTSADVALDEARRPSAPHSAQTALPRTFGSPTVFQPGTKVPRTKRGDRPGCRRRVRSPLDVLGSAMPKRLARRPAGQRRPELGLALVELQRAVLAQHASRAGAVASAPSIRPRRASSARPARRGSPRSAAARRRARSGHSQGSSFGR